MRKSIGSAITASVSMALFLAVAPLAKADLTAPDLNEAWSNLYPTHISLASPTVADINGDGIPEIIFGGQDGIVHVLRADGSELWSRPAVINDGGPAVAIDASITVADIDGDGVPELIVSAASIDVPHQSGGVIVFSNTGAVKWRWHGGEDIFNLWNPNWGTRPDGYREGAVSSAAVGDINGDGKLEVVVAAMDNRIHVFQGADGSELPGWNSRGLPGFWVDDAMYASPAVFDGNGDGKAEIYVGRSYTHTDGKLWPGGVFMAIGMQNGGPAIEWQNFTGDVMHSSPAIADLNGDGRPVVVVGSGYEYAARTGTPDARSVFAWHADDGSPVPGWPRVLNGHTFSAPTIGDVNGDGKLDVVIGTDPRPGAGSGDGHVYALRADGSTIWEQDPHQGAEGGGGILGSPTLADLNGDGINDVVVANGWATFTLNGRDGSRLYAGIRKGWIDQNSPAVAKFGNLGWRIITIGFDGANPNRSAVTSLPIPTPGTTPPWPQWRGGPRHTGVDPSAIPVCDDPPAVTAAGVIPPSGYHPLSPTRVYDTRTAGLKRAIGAGCTMVLNVPGQGGVPSSGANAVSLNVTVTDPMASGYLTVYPCGSARPTSSSLNFVRGQSVANLVTVGVGRNGGVCFYTYARTHIIVDVAGWYGSGGDVLIPVAPTRFVDTRLGGAGRGAGPLSPGEVLDIPIRGVAPVPGSNVSAVAMNLTAVGADGPGYLTAYPCGTTPPSSSSVNYSAGQIVANHVVAPLGSNGHVCVTTYTRTHVLIDVMGYFSPVGSGLFHSLTPVRLADTRAIGHRLAAFEVWPLTIAGAGGVPSGATGVVLNVTAVNPGSDGYVTVYPCGGSVPLVSSLNYVGGANVPNFVAVGLGQGGAVCFSSYADSDVIVDVSGYYQ